jgi:putative transposase
MKALAGHHPVKELCAAFGVSRSGCYAWLARPPSARTQADAELTSRLCQAHDASRGTHGSPRLVIVLRRQGRRISRRRVQRLMRAAGRRGLPRRRRVPRTTDSRHDQPIAPNRLAEVPPPRHRDQIWVTDITHVPTEEGWLHVAGVMDRWSRRVVGLAMAGHLRTEPVTAALQQARTRRQPARGCQHASTEYRRLLGAHGLEASMSRAGNCYDNAAMESFWSTLKNELVHRRTFATRAQARAPIFEYVEVFYNRQRLHSALDYKSPVDFENQNNQTPNALCPVTVRETGANSPA